MTIPGSSAQERKTIAHDFMKQLVEQVQPGRLDQSGAKRLARKAYYLADALEAEGERKGRQMRKGSLV